MRKIAITIKPTNDCNMRCKHCYHVEEGFDSTIMEVDHAKRMLLLASKEYDEIHIMFHGGEPTLWGINNFREFLEYETYLIKEHRDLIIKNAIQSNGLIFNNDWMHLFKEHRFSVGVSFDGPHNDDLRSHTSVIYNNLLLLKTSGIRFGVVCVESALSIHNLRKTYEWFKSADINFKILALFMLGGAKEHAEFQLDLDEYLDELVAVYRYWLFDKECAISVNTFEDFLKVSDKLYRVKYGGSCIYNRICLNPNGDLYPCGRPYPKTFMLGNIENIERISDAFSSPAYTMLAQICMKRLRVCEKECKYAISCKGGCISSAILEGAYAEINNTMCIRGKRTLDAITKVNRDIYAIFDEKQNLDVLNPRALKIMYKCRNGTYDYSHVR